MKAKHLYLLFLTLFLCFTPTVMANSDDVVLRQGDTSEKVWELQQLLDDIGYQIDVDGRFGLQTEIVVKAFQNSFNLKADGVVGSETWSLLRQTNPLLSYTVRRGDTILGLAKKFDTTRIAIDLANNLRNDMIYEGQKLLIPRSWMGGGADSPFTQTIDYEVSSGDTLSALAVRFKTSIKEIQAKNNLQGERILVGQKLNIPNKIGLSSQGLKRGQLVWPVTGRISSPYGSRVHPIYMTTQFHHGLDIAVPRGTPVKATSAGIVTTSSWFGDYGRAVVIDHGEGYLSVYGHNDTLLVKVGAFVVPGQVIALSGNTGVSTGPHVHFELRHNNKTLDPMIYLMPR